VKASDLLALNEYRAIVWGSRHVDELEPAAAEVLARSLFDDVPLAEAQSVVEEFARSNAAFAPSWAEIHEAWQARRSGVADDPMLVANEWLAEVDRAVHRFGSYRRPEWSDPIIGAAVDQAAGSWQGWCLTPTGGPGADGEPYSRNLAPERDDRFRRAAVAMIRHRRQTGESLPQIVEKRRRQGALEGGLRRLGERSET
jgi:hypothetical protein